MGILIPTIRDLLPYPESDEAIAQGCNCAVARRHGRALMTRTGAPVFAISKACTVHNERLYEVPIWTGKRRENNPVPVATCELQSRRPIRAPPMTGTQPEQFARVAEKVFGF